MKKSTNTKKARGFTIVELLVVIVVIGILAAISIVSYSGVTSKAKIATVKSYVSDVDNMVQSQIAQGGSSAITTAAGMRSFTSADGITTTLSGDVVFVAWTTSLTAATGQNTLKYRYCSAGAAAGGYQIGYWDYGTTNAEATKDKFTGACTTWSAGFAG